MTTGQFEAAWKLARICYWLGGHAPEAEQRAYLEKGIAAAQLAARLQPSKPEGHFWAAANMGRLAENFGVRAGMKYRKPIREELETVLRIDPAFMEGSADRALGRYYFKVPSLFGGSKAARNSICARRSDTTRQARSRTISSRSSSSTSAAPPKRVPNCSASSTPP